MAKTIKVKMSNGQTCEAKTESWLVKEYPNGMILATAIMPSGSMVAVKKMPGKRVFKVQRYLDRV